jgi:hypothetical protein
MLRGFEFSSVPGSLTALLSPFHLHWVFGFGAWQIVGPGFSAVAASFTALELVLLIAVWRSVAQGHLTIEAASLAVLSVAVITDRALAPQYLIWLAPLWALWPVRRSWLVASALSFFIFPTAFYLAGDAGASLMLPTVLAVARNAILIGGTMGWIRAELHTTRNQTGILARKAEV